MQARVEAEHKEFVQEYKTLQGFVQATKDIILETVNQEYLYEIKDKTLGFLNQTPNDMLTNLRNCGRALDFADTKTLLAERDSKWDASIVPQIYFNRVKKAIQGLTQAGITSNLNKHCDMALYFLKASGEFYVAVREWEQRPAGQKAWQNIKTFISVEYAKENKPNKLTTKNFKANMIEEQAEATAEELIAALTKNHTRQIETLIKSTTEAIKPNSQPNNGRKKRQEERRKR
jgi:hypothetical protein